MRLIVRFERLEEIKYISQLDMLRTIHRVLRRADIPVAYSEGFNPQPRVSFGFALSVGLVSYGEYMDIHLKNDISANDFLEKMNAAMPIGMRFTDACAANENVPKMGKMIDCAEFETTFLCKDAENLCSIIDNFFKQDEIIMERHSKKGVSFVDIKPWVYKYNTEITGNNEVSLMTIQALSEQMSVRIDDIVNAIMKFAADEVQKTCFVKKDTLLRQNGSFITPVEYTRMIVEG